MTVAHRQHRAVEWLHRYGRRYPWAWETYAQLQADPPMQWPTWCWMPLAGAYAVLSRGGALSPDQAADIGPLGALAAWRATQGIYRVHPTLLTELLATPITGELPGDVLTRLPEWCVYVETPGVVLWGSVACSGYWAHLEHDANTGRRELRLVLDLDAKLVPAVVHLTGSLADGIRAGLIEARVQALRAGRPEDAPPLDSTAGALAQLEGLVSVLLYLCADDAEINDLREPPPKVVRGAKRPITPAAKSPVVHETGVRLGSALEAAKRRAAESSEAGSSGVAPHVRRAHWHGFWTGPREGPRALRVRWLSPILVGLDGAPEEATVRPVNGAAP